MPRQTNDRAKHGFVSGGPEIKRQDLGGPGPAVPSCSGKREGEPISPSDRLGIERRRVLIDDLAVSDRREVAKRRADMRDQADSPSPLQEGVWAFGRMENALNVNEPLARLHRNFAHTQRAGVE